MISEETQWQILQTEWQLGFGIQTVLQGRCSVQRVL